MLTTLDHVLVAVDDLEKASAEYEALLGRAASWRGRHRALGTANTLFRLSNSYLELLSPSGAGSVGDALRERLEQGGPGLLGLAFGTDDADACADALREGGLPATEPQDGSGTDGSSGAVREWRNVHLPATATRGVLLFAIEHRSPADALPWVAPEDERAAVTGLDHVVVQSPDLDAARRLYGEGGLGLRLALDRGFEARGLRMLFFRVGGVTVEIVGRLGADPRPGEDDQLWGLALQVPDADLARARLVAADVPVSEVRPGHKAGTRVVSVKGGTQGVPTLLIEPVR